MITRRFAYVTATCACFTASGAPPFKVVLRPQDWKVQLGNLDAFHLMSAILSPLRMLIRQRMTEMTRVERGPPVTLLREPAPSQHKFLLTSLRAKIHQSVQLTESLCGVLPFSLFLDVALSMHGDQSTADHAQWR